MFIMTFLGKERMDHHTQEHLHESPWVVTVPLILLAIPSAFIGWFTVKPVLYGGFFGSAIHVAPANNVLEHMGEEFGSPGAFMLSALAAWPVWLAALGVLTAYVFFLWRPALADAAKARFNWLYTTLVDKFGFDWFNENVIMPGARMLGGGLWRFGDQLVIDDGLVNGSARTVGWLGSVMRYAQSGYLYHYAFAMILGLASLLLWLLWRA
jgi:NADH-quinone oxidoreductase subunit L